MSSIKGPFFSIKDEIKTFKGAKWNKTENKWITEHSVEETKELIGNILKNNLKIEEKEDYILVSGSCTFSLKEDIKKLGGEWTKSEWKIKISKEKFLVFIQDIIDKSVY